MTHKISECTMYILKYAAIVFLTFTYYQFDEENTLIKKKIKFSAYLRKFRVEQLQSHK
jgi:hypothetical protein